MASAEHITSYSCNICAETCKTAVMWCPLCDEFLCGDCKRHHSRSKLSKDHKTIQIKDYDKLPKSILALQTRCATHEEKFEVYCNFHQQACCIKCFSDEHIDCRNLMPLHDVKDNTRSQIALLHTEDEVARLQRNLDEICKAFHINLKNLEKQQETCMSEIGHVRRLLNQRLDKIESSIKVELGAKYEEVRSKTMKLLKEFSSDQDELKKILAEITCIKSIDTDVQTFMYIGEIDKIVKRKVKYIGELHEAGLLDEVNLRLTIDPTLKRIQDHATSFGTISFQHHPVGLSVLPLLPEKPAIKPQGAIPNKVDNIKLVPKKTIKLPSGKNITGITGCEILNNGDLLFVDFENKRLLRTDSQGSTKEVMQFNSAPRDIALIDNNTAAVTLRDEENVVLIDLNTYTIVKTFNVTSPCYGIDRVEDKLVVRLNHIGQFLILDVNGKILSRLYITGYYIQDVALFEGKLFCTNCENHAVYCYDLKGELLWKYTDDALRKPYGIGEDKNGNIYVAGRESHSIIVISPDGHKNKVLLTDKQDIQEPYALHVNKSTGQLLVCNEFGGFAFLYDIALI